MPVYDASGNELSAVYDAAGNELNYAYDALGNVIYSKSEPSGPSVNYEDYSYTTKWQAKGYAAQGFAAHDNKLFWISVSNTNEPIEANCYVFNLDDGSQALDTPYVTIYSRHGNNLVFHEYTAYASTAYNPATVYVNQLESDYSFTLDKTLTFDNVYDIDACIDENNPTILWGLSHNYVPEELFITKWDLTNLTDNGDGTFTPRLMHSVSTPRPAGNYMQGTRMHDGMLWYACGNGTQRAYVYAVDPSTGEPMYTIDLETNTEPEGIEWIGNTLYVGFQSMMLREYTFAAL